METKIFAMSVAVFATLVGTALSAPTPTNLLDVNVGNSMPAAESSGTLAEPLVHLSALNAVAAAPQSELAQPAGTVQENPSLIQLSLLNTLSESQLAQPADAAVQANPSLLDISLFNQLNDASQSELAQPANTVQSGNPLVVLSALNGGAFAQSDELENALIQLSVANSNLQQDG